MSIKLNPYLIFDGNAREAVHFYEKALGGKVVVMMAFGDMPADPSHPLSDDMKDRVMHAHLKVGDADLMFSDTYTGMPYHPGDTVQIAIHPEEARAREIFAALEDGGKAVMPLQKTDWSPLYGIVKDKFGVIFQESNRSNFTQTSAPPTKRIKFLSFRDDKNLIRFPFCDKLGIGNVVYYIIFNEKKVVIIESA